MRAVLRMPRPAQRLVAQPRQPREELPPGHEQRGVEAAHLARDDERSRARLLAPQRRGGHEHEALDALGMGDRHLRRDEPAHRAADERGGAGDAERVDDGVDRARVAGDRDRLRGHLRMSEAGEVERDDAVPAPMSAGMTSSQFCQLPLRPWTRTTTGPSPTSMALTARPSTGTQRWAARQSTSIQDAGWRVRTSSVRRSAARGSATRDYASGVVGSCPAAMRIAIDIDSTLHHYWDVLRAPRGTVSASTSRTSSRSPGASRS